MKAKQKITENYDEYHSLVREHKTTPHNPVCFTQDKPSRKDWSYHKSDLMHSSNPKVVNLIAEKKKMAGSSYKFQLICSEFCETPLFRFDSDGSAHQNKHLPLEQQLVITPHFNHFDDQGRNVAYQNDKIKGATTEELKDMNKFFGYFCVECTTTLDNGQTPTIHPGENNLFDLLDLDSPDILSDVNFE